MDTNKVMAMGAPHHRDSDLQSFFLTGAVTLAIIVNTFTHMRMRVGRNFVRSLIYSLVSIFLGVY